MNKLKVTNIIDQVEVNVFELPTGKFSVIMKDLECGETLPFGKIFPADAYSEAVDYASGLVDQNGSPFSLEL